MKKSSTDQMSIDTLKPAVKAKVSRLKKILTEETSNQFQAGDLIIDLQDNCGCKLSWLSAQVGRSEATLSQYASTARAFPPEKRRMDLSFSQHLLTKTAAKRVEQRVKRSTGQDYGIDLSAALQTVSDNNLKTPNKIIVHLRNEARAAVAPHVEMEATLVAAQHPGDVLNKCHLMDYRELVPRIPAGSIHLAHLDPPYASYQHGAGLPHDSAGARACDNDTPEAALDVTCGAFAAIAPLLVKNGCIVLWQAANLTHWQIAKAVQDAGLRSEICLVWDKSRPQAGYPESAFSPRCEFAYILSRVGENAPNCDGSDRDNIRAFAPVAHDRAAIEVSHAYEKPAALMEFLVGKLSPRGGVVADFFACTGSCSSAAHKLGRQWIYCESNPANCDIGAKRLLQTLSQAA